MKSIAKICWAGASLLLLISCSAEVPTHPASPEQTGDALAPTKVQLGAEVTRGLGVRINLR